MKKEEFCDVLGDINKTYVREARIPQMAKMPIWAKWATMAACLCLVIIALPVFHLIQTDNPNLHSYVTSDSMTNILVREGGFSVADSTDTGSGNIPSGAPEPSLDNPATAEAVKAYQNLMNHFEREYGAGVYPDWYGGTYVANGYFLIVNIVNSYEEDHELDKAFYLQIQEWAESTNVGFGGTSYSLNSLIALQKEIEDLPEIKALSAWDSGVNVVTGQVQLAVPSADDALLAVLAKIDPSDDMILIEVGKTEITTTVPVINELDGNPSGYN